MQRDPLEAVFSRLLKEPLIFKSRDVLRHDFVPERLPHREEEILRLGEILAPAIKGSRGSNVLVYGKTGTGKTACVKYVLARLSERCRALGVPLAAAHVNCRVSGTEYRVLSQICAAMGVPVPFTGLASAEVFERLTSSLKERASSAIVVLDEVDALVKGYGDRLLYEFSRVNEMVGGSRVTLIGVSNDTGFKDYLDARVLSSLSEEEVVFKPYSSPELRDILMERAEAGFVEGAVPPGVIDLCAALAASEHGDARRALDLMRVAGEIAEREGRGAVTEECVRMAQKKIDEDTVYEMVRTLPLHSKLTLLAAMRALAAGAGRTTSGEVYAAYNGLCRRAGVEPLTHRRVSTLVNELEVAGIILCQIVNQGRYGRTKRISLSAPREVLERALAQDPLLGPLLE